jgi:hypothetical protein
VLGNHDQKRIATRLGAAQARVAAMLLLTLRGTPTLYYGDEIGMENVAIPPDRVQDPWERNEPGLGRDPARTPMQWGRLAGRGLHHGRALAAAVTRPPPAERGGAGHRPALHPGAVPPPDRAAARA